MQPTPEQRDNVPGPDDLDLTENSDDDLADSEAAAFASGNLDKISKTKDAKRKEKFRDHAFTGAIIILWIIIIATAVAIFSLSIHYLTPYSWLTEEQLGSIQAYVFSGAVVAAFGGYLKKYLD